MSRRSAFFPYSCFRFEVTAFEGSILSFSHSWVKDLLPEEYASQKLKLSESPSLRASGAVICCVENQKVSPFMDMQGSPMTSFASVANASPMTSH